nr:aldehyde dehydrogenase family protein [Paracoccaceae bacterium]
LTFAEELGAADAGMKGGQTAPGAVSDAEGIAATVTPMANTLLGIRHLYECLISGAMPAANGSRKIGDDLYEVDVFPILPKDKMLAGQARGYLHVAGTPKQVSPLEKPAGVIAISGAGNYSSSIEMAMALFLENKAVIHKPHQLNEASDAVWAKVFAPLIERRAVAFIGSDQGREMPALEGLNAIYFTGSTGVAHAIQKAASAPLVSECGGNNPCLIVPGSWTEEEMQRWAVQIASVGKLNGGAVCGRPQTIIASKNWPQRDAFLAALRAAIADQTFGTTTYYPGVDKTKEAFLANQSTAEVLTPGGEAHPNAEFVLIPGIKEDDFAVTNEAFYQIFSELPLDTENNADDFLTKAAAFCNDRLLGSLGCMILVDNETFNANEDRIQQAIRALNYGGIAVNNIPPNVWLNAYLTWGGCGERTEDFVSGVGNFGKALNFENIVKSLIIDDFAAQTFAFTDRAQMDHIYEKSAKHAVRQDWTAFAELMGVR